MDEGANDDKDRRDRMEMQQQPTYSMQHRAMVLMMRTLDYIWSFVRSLAEYPYPFEVVLAVFALYGWAYPLLTDSTSLHRTPNYTEMIRTFDGWAWTPEQIWGSIFLVAGSLLMAGLLLKTVSPSWSLALRWLATFLLGCLFQFVSTMLDKTVPHTPAPANYFMWSMMAAVAFITLNVHMQRKRQSHVRSI